MGKDALHLGLSKGAALVNWIVSTTRAGICHTVRIRPGLWSMPVVDDTTKDANRWVGAER